MAAITVPNRQYVGSARPATMTASLDSSSQGPIQCDSLAGWPSGIGYDEFVVTIGRGTPTEERVLCTSTSGNSLVVKQRGWDDTLAVSHEIGESVEHTMSATDMQDSNDHITSTAAHGSDGDIVGEDRLAQVLASTDLTPPGVVAPFAGATAPTGWLMCDGATLSQSQYPKLYAVLGTRYGQDGAGTFKVPDLRGKTVFGVAAGDTAFDTLGETGGAKTAALAEANLPAHKHATPALTHTASSGNAGTHAHTGSSAAASVAHAHDRQAHAHGQSNVNVVGSLSTVQRSVFTGSNNPNGNVETGSYLIKGTTMNNHNHQPAPGGEGGNGATTSSDAVHSHGVTVDGVGDHAHSVTVGGHAAGETGVGAGAATAFSVLNPYMALNFIIKADQSPVVPMEEPVA